MLIRDATTADAAACARIYAPYVTDTTISFEDDPPTEAEMAERIVNAQRAHCWLIADTDGEILGYCYATEFRARPAYRLSCESSIYLDPAHRHHGLGTALYEELFVRLARRGFRTVLAGMALPNPASEALHRRLGFESVGVYRAVGRKFDAWQDVAMMQKVLVGTDSNSDDSTH